MEVDQFFDSPATNHSRFPQPSAQPSRPISGHLFLSHLSKMSSKASAASLNGSLNTTTSSLPLNSPKMSALTEYNALDPDPPHPSFANIPKSFLLPDGYPDYLRLILTSRVYEITQETPLTSAVNLSAKLGARVVLKREDLQPVFSFKIRGAYNRMANIPEDERWKGVVACSAGTSPPLYEFTFCAGY
jgi:Pyridoxal-phosphate dependent enzyme